MLLAAAAPGGGFNKYRDLTRITLKFLGSALVLTNRSGEKTKNRNCDRAWSDHGQPNALLGAHVRRS